MTRHTRHHVFSYRSKFARTFKKHRAEKNCFTGEYLFGRPPGSSAIKRAARIELKRSKTRGLFIRRLKKTQAFFNVRNETIE